MASKLGKSAIGNQSRADSDAVEETNLTAPTPRLQNVLASDSTNQENEAMIENEFGSEDNEFRKYTQYSYSFTSFFEY